MTRRRKWGTGTSRGRAGAWPPALGRLRGGRGEAGGCKCEDGREVEGTGRDDGRSGPPPAFRPPRGGRSGLLVDCYVLATH